MTQYHLNFQATAQLLAFPPARQRSTIRLVAQELEKRKGRARTAFWRQVVAEIALRLQTFGIADSAIDKELLAFKEAVEDEIHKPYGLGSLPDPRANLK